MKKQTKETISPHRQVDADYFTHRNATNCLYIFTHVDARVYMPLCHRRDVSVAREAHESTRMNASRDQVGSQSSPILLDNR